MFYSCLTSPTFIHLFLTFHQSSLVSSLVLLVDQRQLDSMLVLACLLLSSCTFCFFFFLAPIILYLNTLSSRWANTPAIQPFWATGLSWWNQHKAWLCELASHYLLQLATITSCYLTWHANMTPVRQLVLMWKCHSHWCSLFTLLQSELKTQ